MLIVPVMGDWFDMVLQGIKRADYRTINKYWTRRLKRAVYENEICMPSDEEFIQQIRSGRAPLVKGLYRNGYSSKDRTLSAWWRIKIGVGVPEWGAPKEEVYILEFVMWKDVTGRENQ